MSVVLGPDWQLEGLSGMEASLMYHARHESFDLIVNAVDANRDGSIELTELVNFQLKLQKLTGEEQQEQAAIEAEAAELLKQYGDGRTMPGSQLRTLLQELVSNLGAGKFKALVEACKRVVIKDGKPTTDKLAGMLEQRFSSLHAAFLKLDDDRSGKVSVAEIRRQCANFNLDQHQAEAVLLAFDADNNGELDYAEFAKYVGYVVC